MADRGFLFSAPMVIALLQDRKWQTRRIAKPRSKGSILGENVGSGPWDDSYIMDPANRDWLLQDAAARPGDTAYAKETIKHLGDGCSVYAADMAPTPADAWPWKVNTMVSQYMPRRLARIERKVLDVRIERLTTCSESDAVAEGIYPTRPPDKDGGRHFGVDGLPIDEKTAARAYRALWEHINGPGSWDVNPLAFVYTFERVQP